jgi:hypothetical protein
MRRGCKAEAVMVVKGVRDREGKWQLEWDAAHWTGEDADLPAGFADTLTGVLCRAVATSYVGEMAVQAGSKILGSLMKGRSDGNGRPDST